MSQKNEKPVCMVNAYMLKTLSKSALHAYIKMLTEKPEFVQAEMQTLTGNSASVNYGILREWMQADLVAHTHSAPGRQSAYAIKNHLGDFQRVSLTTTNLNCFDQNKTNVSAEKVMENTYPEDTKRLAAKFRLPVEFLEAKLVEREQATGRPRDYAYTEMVLTHAKHFANKSFEGLFYYLFIRVPYFQPSLSFYTASQPQREGTTPAHEDRVAQGQPARQTMTEFDKGVLASEGGKVFASFFGEKQLLRLNNFQKDQLVAIADVDLARKAIQDLLGRGVQIENKVGIIINRMEELRHKPQFSIKPPFMTPKATQRQQNLNYLNSLLAEGEPQPIDAPYQAIGA